MRKQVSIVLFFLSGCMSSNGLGSSVAADNSIYGLSQIRLGMNESEVLKIMNKPYKQKSVEYKGNMYDFWFYITKPSGLGQSYLVRQNLTPVAFENGSLVGWGFNYYDHIMQEVNKPEETKQAPTPTPTPTSTPPTPTHTHEDRGIEKALKSLQTPSQSKTQNLGDPSIRKPTKEASIPKKDILGMSSKPASSESSQEDSESNSKSPLKDEDKEMLQDEREQDFDFW